jgi:crossover junction endodeoxyribonuclease RuvC
LEHAVLAIDPGSRNLGYAIIDHGGNGLFAARVHGVIRYKGSVEFVDRLTKVHEDVFDLIHEYKPDAFAIEKAFVGESVQSAMKLGEARAAAIVAAGRHRIPIFEITPAEAKKSVAGNGRASKDTVRTMVTQLLNLPPKIAYDASDALCIGMAYLFRRETSVEVRINKPRQRRTARSKWTLEDIAAGGLEYRE